MNKDKLNYKSSITLIEFLYLIIYLSFIFVFSYWSYENFSITISAEYASIIFPWIILSLSITLVGFILIYKTPLSDVAIWFVLVSYLFMFGHVFFESIRFTYKLNVESWFVFSIE